MIRIVLYTAGAAATALLLMGAVAQHAPQPASPQIHVSVVLVQVNVAVTDRDGHYIGGLRPQDFQVTEDRIPEKIAGFEEGDASGRRKISLDTAAAPDANVPAAAPPAQVSDANVFILFDTSNYMYRGFVFAQDAIAGFIRSMEAGDKIAFYSYSRDLSRGTSLTSDHTRILEAVRSTVAGDNAALYNSLLMTVQDAIPLRGRKAIVVFSNGPDDASSVPPEDVEELAQSTGTIVYIISTRQAQEEPVSAAVFERMSKATGGKAYFARNWEDEGRAFDSIRNDLAHLYTLSYYPRPNPNHGWRRITVRLVGKNLRKYRLRTRDGYRLIDQAAPLARTAAGAARSANAPSKP